jgi:hypothetical protein
MVGDNIGWCFQSLLYISIYGRCGCAKYINSNKIGGKSEKIGMVGDDNLWCFQHHLHIFMYGR